MKRFLKDISVFFLPILLVLFVYEYPMHIMKETMPIEEVLAEQEEHSGLFMRKYLNQEFNTYKTIGLEKTQAKIVVVGSSRVMQFREAYFKEKFYNAGGLLQNHKDLLHFLKNHQQSDFYIIGIDSWWFKKDNVKKAKTWLNSADKEIVSSSSRYHALKNIRHILKDFTKSRIGKNVGAGAQLNNGGFRLDGSMKIPDDRVALLLEEGKFVDTESPAIPDRIVKGLTSRFSFDAIDTSAFLETIDEIKKFEAKGKKLLVYLPPFTNNAFGEFANTVEQKAFYTFTTVYMPQEFERAGLSVVAAETPADYGLEDTFFMDGIHPSEVFVAMQVLRHQDKFHGLTDSVRAEAMILGRYCDLLFDKQEFLNTKQMQEI